MAHAHVVLPLALLLCAACPSGEGLYVGPQCHSIGLSTPLSSLPLDPAISVTSENYFAQSAPFILANDDIACCAGNLYGRAKPGSCSVDCDALRSRLSTRKVNEPYAGERCGNDGFSQCSVVIENNAIVGVSAFCAD